MDNLFSEAQLLRGALLSALEKKKLEAARMLMERNICALLDPRRNRIEAPKTSATSDEEHRQDLHRAGSQASSAAEGDGDGGGSNLPEPKRQKVALDLEEWHLKRLGSTSTSASPENTPIHLGEPR